MPLKSAITAKSYEYLMHVQRGKNSPVSSLDEPPDLVEDGKAGEARHTAKPPASSMLPYGGWYRMQKLPGIRI